MVVGTNISKLFSCLVFALSMFTSTVVLAQDTAEIDIAEFNQILTAISKADIPDNIKDQLFLDLKISMIENVKLASIPEAKKKKLIKDLESASRK